MRARRLLMAIVMACIPVATAVTPAGAVPPIRTCPPPFQGPWTFQQVIDEFPPPPDVDLDNVFAVFDFYDKNDDGNLCVMGLPNGAINVIDNAANVH